MSRRSLMKPISVATSTRRRSAPSKVSPSCRWWPRPLGAGDQRVSRSFGSLPSLRLPKQAVRAILGQFDIDMTDDQFEEACAKLNVGPGGEVPYDRFMALWKVEDKSTHTSVVRGVSVHEAIRIIRESIDSRLASGPDGLRRAFQYFDADGSGAISIEEFRVLLDRKLNLVFTEEILRQVMARFDDTGTGEIDYRKFTELVMGSKRDESTSLMTALSGRQGHVSADAGNSAMMLRRKFTMSWKDMLHTAPGEKWAHLEPLRTLPAAFINSMSEFHGRRALIFATGESRLWKDHHIVQCTTPLPPRWDSLDNADDPVKALDVVSMEPVYFNEGQCDITAAQYERSLLGKSDDTQRDDPVLCYTLSTSSTSITVPYPTAFRASSSMAMAAHLLYTKYQKRDYLVSYAGGSHGLHPVLRKGILDWCTDASECKVHNCNRKDDCVDNLDILHTYSRSVFCLQPDGDTPTRQGWFDAMLSGCIPVFFSSCLRPNLFYERAYAPFLPAYNRTAYGAGDWAVVVNSSAPLSSLGSTLRNLGADDVRRMQRRIADISPGIQYSATPGAVRDAQTIYTELLDKRYGL